MQVESLNKKVLKIVDDLHGPPPVFLIEIMIQEEIKKINVLFHSKIRIKV
jgi:hypothetical protein